MLVRPVAAAFAAVASVVAVGLGTSPGQASPSPIPIPKAAAAPVRVVAVGDIACPPGRATTRISCKQNATARLTRQLQPDAVLALGDLQYDVGALTAFRGSYDKSWGRLKNRTYAIPGNHEYDTSGASGYYSYFAGTPSRSTAPGYYRRKLGEWQVYLLNTNCGTQVDCAAEARWLENRLRNHPSRCTLFAAHHPRFSSGEHGSNASMGRFFRIAYRHDVEIFLSGHDHHYERFRPMDDTGTRRRDGVVQFVSGTGGKSLYPMGARVPGSRFARDNGFGVLRLTLRPSSYTFAHKAIGGGTPDSGRRSCS